MNEPLDGVDGWQLDDYEWDPATGLGLFEYERRGNVRTVHRPQPATPAHVAWRELGRRPQGVLRMSE